MKHVHRKHIRKIIKGLDSVTLQIKSNRACELLVAMDEYRRAEVVMLFLSMAGEIDTATAIRTALADNKTVAVPVVDFARKVMVAVELKNLDEDMPVDEYGIRMPRNANPVNIAGIDLIVVPGLGFDTQGNRLGRGGGYYDKFLGNPCCRAVKCGLAFEEQITESIPTHSHDIKVDMLVTDSCVRRYTVF